MGRGEDIIDEALERRRDELWVVEVDMMMTRDGHELQVMNLRNPRFHDGAVEGEPVLGLDQANGGANGREKRVDVGLCKSHARGHAEARIGTPLEPIVDLLRRACGEEGCSFGRDLLRELESLGYGIQIWEDAFSARHLFVLLRERMGETRHSLLRIVREGSEAFDETGALNLRWQ